MDYNRSIFFRIAESLYDQRRYNDALVEVEKGVVHQPDSSYGISLRGMIFYKLEKWERSHEDFERAIKLVIGSNTLSDLSAGAKRNAAHLYKCLAEVHWQVALRTANDGEWQKAFDAYKTALDLDDSSATWFSEYGRLLRQRGRIDEAIAAFRRSLIIDPNLKIAREGLHETQELMRRCFLRETRSLKAAGKESEALAEVERGLELLPNDYSLLILKASILLALKRTAESRSLAQGIAAALSLARLERNLDTNESTVYRRALELLGRISANLARQERTGMHRKELWSESRTYYLKALAIDESMASYWFGLALANKWLGNGDETVRALQQYAIRENTYDAYIPLVWEALRNLNFKAARDAWTQLRTLNPK